MSVCPSTSGTANGNEFESAVATASTLREVTIAAVEATAAFSKNWRLFMPVIHFSAREKPDLHQAGLPKSTTITEVT